MLADNKIYLASESTFYRVLKAENLLSHRGRSKPRRHTKPKSITAAAPNKVWCWDISYLPTNIRGQFYYLYFVIDIYSRKIVGYDVHTEESSEHASTLFNRLCKENNIAENSLHLHSDNGAPMKGSALISTLIELGIARSYSRPSVSNDNPYIESAFKTVKYSKTYPNYFDSLDLAKSWVDEFVSWYNKKHLHSSLKFVTPEQRHQGEDKFILKQRAKVYEIARSKNPERWSKGCRNWRPRAAVTLNPSNAIKMAVNN